MMYRFDSKELADAFIDRCRNHLKLGGKITADPVQTDTGWWVTKSWTTEPVAKIEGLEAEEMTGEIIELVTIEL